MKNKVYVLIDIIEGKIDSAVKTLRDIPGVITADVVEGSHNLVLVLEASERLWLAEQTVNALNLLGTVIERVEVLPVKKIPVSLRN